MELVSAPLVSISRDGRVKTRVKLRWGPSLDKVVLEGSVRALGGGELELMPMTARSIAMKFAYMPPLQPARPLRVAYADSELLVLRDRQGAVDVLWREGDGAQEAPRADSAAPTPPPTSGPRPSGGAPVAHAGLAEKRIATELKRLREREGERIAAELKKLREREEERIATERKRLQEREEAIDTKLRLLDEWDPLAKAEMKLHRFEERASAGLQGVDARLERLLGQTTDVERFEQRVRTLSLELDAKLNELAHMTALVEDHTNETTQQRLAEAEAAVTGMSDAAAQKLDGKVQEVRNTIEKELKQLEDAVERRLKTTAKETEDGVQARLLKQGADFEQRVSARLEQQGKLFEQMVFARLEKGTLAELQARLERKGASFEQDLLARLEQRGEDLEHGTGVRLEEAGAAVEQGALARIKEQGAGVEQELLSDLRAESKRFEEALGKQFQALEAKMKELQTAAPGRSRGLRQEIRAELEALREVWRKPSRRIWPWSSS